MIPTEPPVYVQPPPPAALPPATTPAHKDKHLFTTLLFVLIVVLNHKCDLGLSLTELGILAASMGIYVGQSQLAAVAKFKALMEKASA